MNKVIRVALLFVYIILVSLASSVAKLKLIMIIHRQFQIFNRRE